MLAAINLQVFRLLPFFIIRLIKFIPIGPLPFELFNSTRLNTFSASSNCFGGNLSPKICSAKNLVTLVLDGLSSNKKYFLIIINVIVILTIEYDIFIVMLYDSCNYAWNDKIKYFPYMYFESSIPKCLMNMPMLNQIYLAGNIVTVSSHVLLSTITNLGKTI